MKYIYSGYVFKQNSFVTYSNKIKENCLIEPVPITDTILEYIWCKDLIPKEGCESNDLLSLEFRHSNFLIRLMSCYRKIKLHYMLEEINKI